MTIDIVELMSLIPKTGLVVVLGVILGFALAEKVIRAFSNAFRDDGGITMMADDEDVILRKDVMAGRSKVNIKGNTMIGKNTISISSESETPTPPAKPVTKRCDNCGANGTAGETCRYCGLTI